MNSGRPRSGPRADSNTDGPADATTTGNDQFKKKTLLSLCIFNSTTPDLSFETRPTPQPLFRLKHLSLVC
jgi:hypothetical protein